MKNTFIIAEIGINHNGSLEIAKKLIDLAGIWRRRCEISKRTIDIVYTEEELNKPRETPFGNTNRDLKEKLEFGESEYDEIDSTVKKNIIWFASCWDIDSVDFIEKYNPKYQKIASACITDFNLLEKFQKPMGK